MLRLKKVALFLLPYSFVAMTSYAHQENVLLSVASPSLNLKQATLIKQVAPKTQISFIVWLKLRNKQELDQLVQDVYDYNSSRYHQFLTPALYEEEFAPGKEAEEAVQQFFASYGMQAKIINHSVRVTGSVEHIEQAFHVQINYYQYQNERVRASFHAPQLNPEIAQYILEITGLSTIPEVHPNLKSSEHSDNANHDLNFIWHNFAPSAIPTDIS